MLYHCPHCKTEVTLTKREHLCIATRSIGGEMLNSWVVYAPNLPKANKQSTPGYMKRFGSKPAKKQTPVTATV